MIFLLWNTAGSTTGFRPCRLQVREKFLYPYFSNIILRCTHVFQYEHIAVFVDRPELGNPRPFQDRSKTQVPDSWYWIPDFLSVGLGFCIPIISGIPDSKAQDSGFLRNFFPGFRIPQAKISRFLYIAVEVVYEKAAVVTRA